MNINGVKIFDQNTDTYNNFENNLKPTTLVGIVMTTDKEINGQKSNYKLVVPNGNEYFFIQDKYWDDLLAYYVKREVKVKALRNVNTKVLFPQLIYPVGPYAPIDNSVNYATFHLKKIVRKIGKNINELVIVPIGLLVLFMAL